MNKVILSGRVGSDAELKYTQGGSAVCKFRLATSETYKDKQGKRQEQTEWHSCIWWGKGGEAMSKYLVKGKLIELEGKLQTTQWEDKNGSKHYTTEVRVDSCNFINERKGDGSERSAGRERQESSAPSGGHGGWSGSDGDPDDDIPF